MVLCLVGTRLTAAAFSASFLIRLSKLCSVMIVADIQQSGRFGILNCYSTARTRTQHVPTPGTN